MLQPQPLHQVALMGSFGLVVSAMCTPQMVLYTIKEEWRCVSMEHLEQSVMWAGTSWMLKWLVGNLVSLVSKDSCVCSYFASSQTAIIRNHHTYRVTSVEWFKFCSMVWCYLSGECDVQWQREIVRN